MLALLAALIWWVRRRELALPLAFAACAILYLASLPTSGDYAQAKALMIAAPLAMLLIVRPLLTELGWTPARRLGWTALAVVFVAGAVYSSFLALRDAPVGPAGHGGELRAFLPILHGKPVLYAGQDRYAAYELLGADTHVPLVEFPDPEVSGNPEKPFDTGDAYSPIDFDSFSRGTLDRFPYVITGRAAWNSQAPPNFKRIAATPSYILWKRTGKTPPDRQVLLEGTEAGAWAGCASPEIRILLSNPGRASLFPADRDRAEGALGHGQPAGGRRSHLAAAPPAASGRWRLSIQYFSPFSLSLGAPGFRHELKPALDGQRPNTISLANDGQYWPAGVYASRGGRVRFTVAAAKPTTLQRLSGYDGTAYIGNLVAVRTGKRRIVPLRDACNGWIRLVPLEGARPRRPWPARRSGETRTTSQTRPSFSRPSMTIGGDVDLPAAEAVDGGGREGVVVVVPGLAEGRDRDQRQVARLVAGLEVAVAEDVAERVDAVGEVVQDEDADQAAPEQAGDRGEQGAADQPAEREGDEEAEDRPVDEGAVDPVDRRILDQVRREALLVAALGVDEEPAHVGVEEAAQGAGPAVAVVDVGAVRDRPLRRRRRGACGGRRPRR